MNEELADTLIVIPCLNEEAHLPGLLSQLLEDNAGGRIVIADGGSKDSSRAIVERFSGRDSRIVLMDNPERLQAAGLNRAVRRYGPGYRWLVRMDAHCDYPPGFVVGLVGAAEAHRAQSVVVPMVSRGVSCFQIAAATAQNSALGNGGSLHRRIASGQYVDHGHHALMDIPTFIAAGGYNEQMSHNEDAELDHRIARTGGRIWLEPSLALDYYPRSAPGALWRQYWRYGRGRAQTFKLHKVRPKPRQLFPLGVPASVALLAALPLSPFAGLPAALWAALCLGTGAIIGARSICGMLSGTAAMIMHLAWGSGFLYEWFLSRAPLPVDGPLQIEGA